MTNTIQTNYDAEADRLYRSFAGRGAFRYRAADDPFYRAARDRYVQDGRLAMRDSMGSAAALTGGYGSSYSQGVGQQRYGEYLRRLSELMPQYYTAALRRWEAQGKALSDAYGMARGLAQDAYTRRKDQADMDYRARKDQADMDYRRRKDESDAAYRMRKDERDEAYRQSELAYRTEKDRADAAYRTERDQADAAYRSARDAESDRRWAAEQGQKDRAQQLKQQQDSFTALVKLISSSGYTPGDEELRAAGLSRAAAEALRQEYLRQNGLLPLAAAPAPAYGGGGSGKRAAASTEKKSASGDKEKKSKRLLSGPSKSASSTGSTGGGGKRVNMVR